ncbi:uncharacterized protein LOC126894563 isoform X1 [Daktulosphaira vitifoliae]|uniref:uncharacterized protein LOC126894563 isoform X1 n=1 Tax=Daktulosphaira vitifoliae TaxID=58002 RepID=UPI0021A978D1|nr:uncharacterized protein LOC126894563 isoform X1 [Daktulosphaira vitifoliae]
MYIFFFIMMYLASSLSNAFLFTVPPFDENSKLTDTSETELKHIFQKSKCHDEGIDFVRFKNLLLNFNFLHKYDEHEIEYLFIEVVGEIYGLMDEKQFLKQAIKVIERIEKLIENLYKISLINDKMTITELKSALLKAKYTIKDERATELINIEKTDPQNISRKAFRNIFAKLYVPCIQNQQEVTTLKKIFSSYETLDPR